MYVVDLPKSMPITTWMARALSLSISSCCYAAVPISLSLSLNMDSSNNDVMFHYEMLNK
jgi:hypothetical protein